MAQTDDIRFDRLAASMTKPGTAVPPAVGSAGKTGDPKDGFAPMSHTHESSVKKNFGLTDANGRATILWDKGTPFAAPPIPFGIAVEDAAGAGYEITIVSNAADKLVVQVRKVRTLPVSITLLTQLVGFEVNPPAATGTKVYAAAGPITV